MTLSRIRRIGRGFAVLLLAWTAADLCDYSLCGHSREPLVPFAAGSPGREHRVVTPEAPLDAPETEAVDDCFCCSRFVDVQVPFSIALTLTIAWQVPDETPSRPHLTSFRLYHPPLA